MIRPTLPRLTVLLARVQLRFGPDDKTPIGIRVKRPAENMQSVIPLCGGLRLCYRAFRCEFGRNRRSWKCVENWPLLEALTALNRFATRIR